jgi:hypothetical protein
MDRAFERLERAAGKLARRVLGGEDDGNIIFLPDHNARPHQSLGRNSPVPREIEPRAMGKVIAIPQVGGLHHLYRRAA